MDPHFFRGPHSVGEFVDREFIEDFDENNDTAVDFAEFSKKIVMKVLVYKDKVVFWLFPNVGLSKTWLTFGNTPYLLNEKKELVRQIVRDIEESGMEFDFSNVAIDFDNFVLLCKKMRLERTFAEFLKYVFF